MQLTCCNTSTLAKLDTLGQDFDADLHAAKNAIHKKNCDNNNICKITSKVLILVQLNVQKEVNKPQ